MRRAMFVTRSLAISRKYPRSATVWLRLGAAARQAAYKGRLRVRPAAQRVYINALWRARVQNRRRTNAILYNNNNNTIYRARPGCVLLVLHTAKRVVTTGALPSAAPVAAARRPSLRPERRIPTRRTHTRALTATHVPSAAGWCARVQSCCITHVRHCIGVSTRTYQSFLYLPACSRR